MLSVRMTPNLLGIEITGDYDELNRLYDAVWAVVGHEYDQETGATEQGVIMRTRLLALCYDLRKAYEAGRNIRYVDNGMDRDKAQYLELGLPPLQNLEYSVEVLYPEALYEVMLLGYLLSLYQAKLVKRKSFSHYEANDPRVVFDPVCAEVRMYQSLVLEAVRERTSSNTFSRIRKKVTEGQDLVYDLYPQWVDIINIDWCDMTPKKRQSGLSTVARDIADHYSNIEYLDLKRDIDAYVRETGASRDNVQLAGLDYPEEYDW
ncbi:MAG: hypothetical protein Q4A01_08250 [Coriobacteriales bacterium]|nr:hypothetical protein [Coriobacteriales bacterium]